MKNIIQKIKYNRLPVSHKIFIDFITKCEIIKTDECIEFINKNNKLIYYYEYEHICSSIKLQEYFKSYYIKDNYIWYAYFLNDMFKKYTNYNLSINNLTFLNEY